MKPQKQLLQFVMLALLSVVSVLVTSNESFAALDCGACHGVNAADMRPLDGATRDPITGAFVGSHQKHLPAAIPASTGISACAACHSNASHTTDAAYALGSHRDGGIQLSTGVGYVKGVFFNQTSVPTLSSCSTAVCHNSTSTTVGIATPTWGTTASCSSCHEVSPTTLSHQKHLAVTSFKKAICIDCHASTVEGVSTTANHVNNSISVTGYTAQNKTKGSAVSTCATTYCHSSGQGATAAVATPVYSSVTWGGSVTCGSCHATTTMATGSHTRHLDKDTNCGSCHTGAAAASYPSTTHVDGSIDVAAGVGYTAAGTAGNGYGTCSAASCHAYYTDVAPKVTRIWGAASISCSACHAATPVTGAHTLHMGLTAVGAGNCDYCHASSADLTHVNGFVNVSGTAGKLMAAPVQKHASNAYAATCTTTCHSAFTTAGTTPKWDAQSNCTTCHTANTGAHTAHINSAAVLAAAGNVAANSCGVCHAGATTTAGGANHANGLVNVTQVAGGTTPKHAAGAYSATCTTSCHNPYSDATGIATPNWGTTGVACTVCHTAGFTATGPATGSHAAHTAAVGATCTSCHASGTSTTTLPSAGHLDGNIDAIAYDTQNKAKGTGPTTCTTSACHNDPYGAGKVVTPAWGTSAGCKACHTNALTNDFAAGPATGSHAKHMNTAYATYAASIGCASCHTTPGAGATHNAGTVDVIQYAAAVPKHAGAPYLANGCAAASCHQGTLVLPAPAATWGASTGCNACHGFPPATGGHTNVLDGNCNSCHSDVTPGSWTATTATISDPTKHMDGKLLGGQCNSCHGYPPVQTLVGLVNYSGAKLQNYSGGGGAHSVAGHVKPTARPTSSFGTVGAADPGCATCHAGSHNSGAGTFLTANVNVVVDPQFKFNKDLPIVYNKAQSAKTSATCSNVSCHFKASPIWSTESYTTGH